MHIAVGSTNAVKINAVIHGVAHLWPDAIVEGFETESGVSHQPITDHETKLGSLNRAKRALAALREKHRETLFGADELLLGVGLEGGVDQTADGVMNVVWCTVVDEAGSAFASSGARFVLDPVIANRILGGEEMGPIMDSLVQDTDVKKKQGMIGVVTKGFYTRTEEYASIARLTIGLWYGQHWRKDLQLAS